MNKKVIICADDFGLHPAINSSIIELSNKGKISAVTVLVSGPSYNEHDWKQLRQFSNEIEIGLHLWVPQLNLKTAALAVLTGKVNISQISILFEKQLAKFQDSLGFFPHFIDSHYHMHQLPVLRDAVINIATKYAQKRFYLRNTYSSLSTTLSRDAAIIKNIGLSLLARKFKCKAERSSIKTNQGYGGAYYYYPHTKSCDEIFIKYLQQIDNNNYLINLHPSHQTTDQSAPGELTYAQRFIEFKFLLSERFERTLRQNDLSISKYEF